MIHMSESVQEAADEYDSLPRGSGAMKLAQANMARNRYCDVLPYDRNAVVLPGASPPLTRLQLLVQVPWEVLGPGRVG